MAMDGGNYQATDKKYTKAQAQAVSLSDKITSFYRMT